jgi:AcrR family transcriptional regulator
LYAAFGSKERLFKEAVQLYTKMQNHLLEPMTSKSTAREAVEALLMGIADAFSQAHKPHGCLVILGAINSGRGSKRVQESLRDQRALRQKLILERLQRGVTEGDIAPEVDLKSMAIFYSTVMNGLAIEARDGAMRKELRTIVESAMTAWDALVMRRNLSQTSQ